MRLRKTARTGEFTQTGLKYARAVPRHLPDTGVAMIYPDQEQGKKTTCLEIKQVNRSYLSHARTVLTHLPAKLAACRRIALQTRQPLHARITPAVVTLQRLRTRAGTG